MDPHPGPFHVTLSASQVAEALYDYCGNHHLAPAGRYDVKIRATTEGNEVARVDMTFTRTAGGAP